MKIQTLVIIVTYNARKWIDYCLNSVQSSTVKTDVFVVDNGSTDGTQDYIKRHFPNVLFRQSEGNLGFGGGNNIGLQYAIDHNYDYVYLLNQDAWIFPDTIGELIRVSKENPEYGILSPMQMQANQEHLDKNFLINVSRLSNSQSLIEEFYFKRNVDVFNVGFVMAAHWMITRDCLLATGGFSPTFHQYGEDGNYIDRVKYNKFKIGVVLSSRAVHDREYRKETKKQLLHQYYTNNLQIYSTISEDNNINTVSYLFLTCFKLKSIKPFFLFAKILYNMRHIRHNKAISYNKMAFLKGNL